MKLILFDLDGTLLDTGLDLAHALNRIRADQHLPPLEYSHYRNVISYGTPKLLKVAINQGPGDDHYDHYKKIFINYYQDNIFKHTQFFEGIIELLAQLETNQTPWGIVTNKEEALAHDLLNQAKLKHRAHVIVCGDTIAVNKPHPAPIIHACDQLGFHPNDTTYIGDSENDMLAANRAGTQSILAKYGYISPTDPIHQWGADIIVNSPLELANHVL